MGQSARGSQTVIKGELKAGFTDASAIVRALFPSMEFRFAVALLLTFFPLAFLFPLNWPVREIVTLIVWFLVFPSAVGFLSFALVPFLPNEAYGYWAFNAFCFLATVQVLRSTARCQTLRQNLASKLHVGARCCMLMTFAIGVWQILSRPERWALLFEGMSLGDGGRGAGLRLEPSLLAAPLALYLGLLVWRAEAAALSQRSNARRHGLLLEGLVVTLCAVAMTQSISVLLVGLCFAPSLGLRLTKAGASVTLSGMALSAITVFGDRMRQALANAAGSFVALITIGLASWRSVPDLLIIFNYREFLLPGNPAEVRTRISTLASGLDPSLSWIENTYSTFSAGTSSLGLLVTACVFIAGLALGLRKLSPGPLRLTWVLLYLANWFITPKFEAAGWVTLGLLAVAHSTPERRLIGWVDKMNRRLGLPVFPNGRGMLRLRGGI